MKNKNKGRYEKIIIKYFGCGGDGYIRRNYRANKINYI